MFRLIILISHSFLKKQCTAWPDVEILQGRCTAEILVLKRFNVSSKGPSPCREKRQLSEDDRLAKGLDFFCEYFGSTLTL